MACAGILLALCLGGAAAGSGAPGANSSLPVADELGLALLAALPLAVGLFVWRRWYDLRRAPRRNPLFSPATGMGLFLAMLVLGMVGSLIVSRLLSGGTSEGVAPEASLADTARVMLGGVAGQAIVVAVYARYWRRAPRSRGPGSGRAALAGVAAFLLAWPVVASTAFATGLLAEWITGKPTAPIAHQTLLALVEGPRGAWYWVMVVAVIGVVPMLEEVMYRGILQRTLVELAESRWPAIVAASAVFALMHWGAVPWHALPPLFVLSLGFGWIYERTGRLSSCIMMHAMFNAVNVVMAGFATAGA